MELVLLAIGGDDFDRGGCGGEAFVTLDRDFAAERGDAPIVHARIAKLLDAGFAGDEGGSDRVLDAHLALAARRNIRAIGARGKERIASHGDLFDDRVGVRAPPVDHTVEHRMDDEAARIRLESGLHDFPAIAETLGETRQLWRLGQRMEIALAAGERLGGAGQVIRRQ